MAWRLIGRGMAHRKKIALILPFLLSACAESQPVDGNVAWEPIEAEADAIVNEVDAGPDLTAANLMDNGAGAVPVGPADAADADGARALLIRWAAALERRDWAMAHSEWGDGGAASGMDTAQYAASYEKYASIDVAVGDGAVEGAAGALLYRAPVTITGTLASGEPVRLEGTVTLRRVNDVPGATADQTSWHIAQSELKPRP